jgi:hypothetical protein
MGYAASWMGEVRHGAGRARLKVFVSARAIDSEYEQKILSIGSRSWIPVVTMQWRMCGCEDVALRA